MQAQVLEDERVMILTRKLGEKLVVGLTTITIVAIDRDKVRLGIDSPKDVPVYRLEYMPEMARPKNEVTNVGE